MPRFFVWLLRCNFHSISKVFKHLSKISPLLWAIEFVKRWLLTFRFIWINSVAFLIVEWTRHLINWLGWLFCFPKASLCDKSLRMSIVGIVEIRGQRLTHCAIVFAYHLREFAAFYDSRYLPLKIDAIFSFVIAHQFDMLLLLIDFK